MYTYLQGVHRCIFISLLTCMLVPNATFNHIMCEEMWKKIHRCITLYTCLNSFHRAPLRSYRQWTAVNVNRASSVVDSRHCYWHSTGRSLLTLFHICFKIHAPHFGAYLYFNVMRHKIGACTLHAIAYVCWECYELLEGEIFRFGAEAEDTLTTCSEFYRGK